MMKFEDAEKVSRTLETIQRIDRALQRLDHRDKPPKGEFSLIDREIGRGMSEDYEPMLSAETAKRIRAILRDEYVGSRTALVEELSALGVDAPPRCSHAVPCSEPAAIGDHTSRHTETVKMVKRLSPAGRLFQARMWREYAMAWDGRPTSTTGVERAWVATILRVSRSSGLRRARLNVYLAKRARRGTRATAQETQASPVF